MYASLSNAVDMKKLIGARLRDARIEMGYSQEELGDMLGITHAAIGSYERGRLKVSIPLLIELAHALEKPLSFFIAELEDASNQLQQRMNARQSNYDLKENIEFELEMSIRNYLKLHGMKDKLTETSQKFLNDIKKYVEKNLLVEK